MASGAAVTEEDLGLHAPRAQPTTTSLDDLTLEEAERVLIQRALTRHAGNVSRAADALGVSRSALYRRIQHFGL
jgi:transcriptional regulator of acetoin/glycerol metabolism